MLRFPFSLPVIACLAVVASGCVQPDDAGPDGDFSGRVKGCADLILVREHAEGRRVLDVRGFTNEHFRDTAYTVDLAAEASPFAVRIHRYDGPGGMEWYCNDVLSDRYPELVDSAKAVSGTLSLVIYDMDIDTVQETPVPFYWKEYRVDASLRDVRFDDGLFIKEVTFDSVRAGWLGG